MRKLIISSFAAIGILTYLFLFSTILKAQSWQGKWITSSNATNAANEWIAYKKHFHVKQLPAKAVIKIAADSKYWLWINGKLRVFEGGLKRGPNPNDTYYDVIDLAPFMRKGVNTLYFQVCYFGKDGFSHKSSGTAGLLVDGKILNYNLSSDSSWQSATLPAFKTAPAPLPNFRLSESSILYDAREELNQIWAPAKVIGKVGDAPWNKLLLRPIPQWKDSGLLPYVNANQGYEQHGDTIFCRLPYNAQFTPYLKVKALAGKRIMMVTDNYVHYNGSSTNLRAEYITKEGIQEYENLGWLNGHWMYYIIPKGVQVLDLKYRETGYNSRFTGSFSSSNDFLNHLWQKARRTLYVTMRDNYMDCPDRERAQWTGDAVLEAEESFYALNTSSHALARKWLYELIGWQRADYSLYSPVPSGNWNKELPDQILASIGYYGIWTYYMHTADLQILKDLYPHIQNYLALWEKRSDGLVNIRQGGWLWGDWGNNKDMLPLFNLWYYLALKGNCLMARELHLLDDVAKYEKAMAKLAETFNKTFWNGESYRDPNYNGLTDDRVQALAVNAGIADKAKYPMLLNIFQTQEHSSPYMEKYVYEAMYRMGYPIAANKRQQSRFSTMVNNHYFTTLFEGWGIGKDGFGGGTVNHAWSGGGLVILSGWLCGLRPLTPGYTRFLVQPMPGNVARATAIITSIKGKIVAGYLNKSNLFILNLTIPKGTSALVHLPGKYKEVVVNGKKHNGEIILAKGNWKIVAEK